MTNHTTEILDPGRPLEIWDTCQACQGEGSTEEHRPQHADPDFAVVIKCDACGGSGWEQVQ